MLRFSIWKDQQRFLEILKIKLSSLITYFISGFLHVGEEGEHISLKCYNSFK